MPCPSSLGADDLRTSGTELRIGEHDRSENRSSGNGAAACPPDVDATSLATCAL